MEYLEFLYFRLTNVFYLTYRALNVLSEECNLIQSELYRNPKSVLKRNDGVLYYDCTNYYFKIEQEDGDKKYGKSKEHRPNPIVQIGLFTDGDGIPLTFSIFPGNQNEQTSLKPLEKKVIEEFGCSESRWQIEACFRIMKTDFSACFCPAKRPDPSTFPNLFSGAVHLSSARKKARAEIYM